MNIIQNLLSTQARRKTILWFSIILIMALILVIISNFLFSNNMNFSKRLNLSNTEKYQAIFLSNGQVYFGKVINANNRMLMLNDIYYLRATQALQSGDQDFGNNADDFSLIKLGNEIHGPEDNMNINLEHILFVENLKDDSKVVEAIMTHKEEI